MEEFMLLVVNKVGEDESYNLSSSMLGNPIEGNTYLTDTDLELVLKDRVLGLVECGKNYHPIIPTCTDASSIPLEEDKVIYKDRWYQIDSIYYL